MNIKDNVEKFLREIPEDVRIVAATKTRSAEEINRAISAGIKIIGENYVQELRKEWDKLEGDFEFHVIGHLQRNKVKYIIDKADMIQSLDSLRLAKEINKRAKKIPRTVDVLLEVNSGEEENKNGIMPSNLIPLLKEISQFENLRIKGLMTMAPFFDNPEKMRPYFRRTKELFEKIKTMDLDNVKMKYLSMGMSGSYKVAIEEGANMVRIGTGIFGPRK